VKDGIRSEVAPDKIAAALDTSHFRGPDTRHNNREMILVWLP
jgi:hypothetical protein